MNSKQLPIKIPRSAIFIAALLCAVVFILVNCINKPQATEDVRGPAFAGSSKCNSCHQDIHASYATAAHRNTSSAASDKTVKGSFEKEKNSYFYRPDVKVVMEQRDSNFYQVAYMNEIEKQSAKFDIVMGSGRKAQTYLYWYGEKVFQLPVSYSVVANSWVNSPLYPAHQVRFDRNIPVGCFECHSSSIKVTSVETDGKNLADNFDKSRIIYGIDCERCHGPAAQHADFHEKHPAEKNAKFISIYSSLPRQQQLDMCAVCHSGIQQTKRSTFHFLPGDTLLNKFFVPPAPVGIADVDVHGNQYQLLTASPCFIKTKTLNCTSCHNTHVSEKDNKAVFSQRCMTCHSPGHNFCKMAPSIGAGITSNCIDCHMPAKPSKLITLLSNGMKSPTPNLVTTHFISIYPEETKAFMRNNKNSLKK